MASVFRLVAQECRAGRCGDKPAELAEQEERRYRAMAVQETMVE